MHMQGNTEYWIEDTQVSLFSMRSLFLLTSLGWCYQFADCTAVSNGGALAVDRGEGMIVNTTVRTQRS